MLSVLVSVRNSRKLASNLLRSLIRTFQSLGTTHVEFILIDDASSPDQEIPNLLADFRTRLPKGVRVTEFLFKEQQHYTRAMAYGLSAAKGEHVLFVSHDMVLTPDYVRTLLAVAASDPLIGLVRGTSPYVDCFPQHVIRPPLPIRNDEDIEAFSSYVCRHFGLYWEEDLLLTGDSMLIKRSVLDRIGVFDPRYFGYFGDIDFGLRLQRAGFRMVCAKGAWLWHEGAGAYKDQSTRSKEDFSAIHERRMKVVNAAYQVFREKWDPSLAPDYAGVASIPFARLQHAPARQGGEHQPLIMPDPAICQIR